MHKSQAYWNELALSLEFSPSSHVAAAKGRRTQLLRFYASPPRYATNSQRKRSASAPWSRKFVLGRFRWVFMFKLSRTTYWMCEDPDNSETPLIYFLNPFVRGEDWPENNSHTNSQGRADNKRGGSTEVHLPTAQIMAPDSLVRLCYIYIIDSLYP